MIWMSRSCYVSAEDILKCGRQHGQCHFSVLANCCELLVKKKTWHSQFLTLGVSFQCRVTVFSNPLNWFIDRLTVDCHPLWLVPLREAALFDISVSSLDFIMMNGNGYSLCLIRAKEKQNSRWNFVVLQKVRTFAVLLCIGETMLIILRVCSGLNGRLNVLFSILVLISKRNWFSVGCSSQNVPFKVSSDN